MSLLAKLIDLYQKHKRKNLEESLRLNRQAALVAYVRNDDEMFKVFIFKVAELEQQLKGYK